MKYTKEELIAFIDRANTIEKLNIADDWISSHVTNQKLRDELAVELYVKSLEILNEPVLHTLQAGQCVVLLG